jgi:hypothetical protein
MPFIELIVVMAIMAAAAIWSSTTLVQTADDLVATSTGVYINNVASSAQRHLLAEFTTLSAGGDVVGTGNDLQPTLNELRTLGRLPPTFPAFTPGNQAVRIFITRTNCPGPSCNLVAMACLTQPLQVRGQFREDLATVAMAAMGGHGGRSHAGAPDIIRGTLMGAVPNPFGSNTGIVCGQSNVDAGVFESFARLRDTRDLDLQGGLTISGTNPTGEALRVNGDIMTVNPATGTVCVRILKNGQIDINCDGRLNASSGTFTGAGGTVRVGQTGTTFSVDTNGRVRAEQGFWSAVGSIFGDNTLGVRAAGNVFTIQTQTGVDALAVHDEGRTGSRTSIATPVLGLTDPVTVGTACDTPGTTVSATNVTAAATTTLRALVGGGLAVCDPTSGKWSPLSRVAQENTPCSPSGIGAVTADGISLICTNGTFIRLDDRMGYLTEVESYEVVDSSIVPKPSCPSGSRGPKLYLGAGMEEQKVQRMNRYYNDVGASWTIYMRDGLNAPISGSIRVTTYCQF